MRGSTAAASGADHITRFRVAGDAALTHREVYGPERLHGAPDGFAFGLPLRRHQLIVVGAIEAAAHGWDAGHGAGRGGPIPDDLAARLLAELPLVIDRNTLNARTP